MTTAQEIFIDEVVRRSGSGGRALLARLVLDARFDRVPEPALKGLISKINTWLPTPLVEQPYGYVADAEKNAVFAGCRKAVRESVPRWK